MSMKVATQLVLLLTALTATILAIFLLKQGHLGSFMTSLTGNSPHRLNWCEERVKVLHILPLQAKLLEKDSKWLWSQGGEERELSYMDVEKWFAKYCQVDFKPRDIGTRENPQPILEAEFINGNRLSLYQFGNGAFQIREKMFESQALRQALQELLAFGPEIQ